MTTLTTQYPALARTRVRYASDTTAPLHQVWALPTRPLSGSRYPGHADADYLRGFLTMAARDAWVREMGFEVVHEGGEQ